MRARLLSPSIHAVRKSLKRFLPVIRSVRLGYLCTRTERPPTMGVPARNTAVRSVSPRPVFALVTTKTGTTARGTEAAPSIRAFQQTTDFPLTGNACVLSVSMPYVQSVRVIIPVLNPHGGNDYGCVTETARQTSIRWPTSPP